MNGEASFEHVVHVQIVECFLFMDLSQHAVDDAVVLHPEDFHLSAGDGGLQTLAQVANDFAAFVDDFEPPLGSSRREFDNAA